MQKWNVWEPEKEERVKKEYFQVTPSGAVRSLLFQHEQGPENENTFSLFSGMTECGMVGAAAIKGKEQVGGWCSFQCHLLVPRRFASGCGEKMVAGSTAQELVCEAVRAAFLKVLMQEVPCEERRMKMQLEPLLQQEAGDALMQMGWLLKDCKLERIKLSGGT